MRKAAHYFYDNDVELVVYVHNRMVYIFDKNKNHPVCPIRHVPHPYPGSGYDPDHPDKMGVDFSYETLGLYYGYGMSGTGWDGDC